jgi:hypothetical protein
MVAIDSASLHDHDQRAREKFSKIEGEGNDGPFFLWLPESSADPCRNLFGGPIVNAIVNLYGAL